MSGSNSSSAVDEAWHNIASSRLRLRTTVYFYEHVYRGVTWLIIADQQTEAYFRCSASAESFLSMLNGSLSVAQAWQQAQRYAVEPSSEPLQKEDIVLLVANLKNAQLLDDEATPDNDGTSPQGKVSRQQKPWLRPFAIKFALLDPDHFLARIAPYLEPLFGRLAMLIWLVLVLIALSLSWLHWQPLVEHAQARFDDPKNLLWYWFLYPLVKALHELGHGVTTRLWGGVVHEMGIMLLVFFPVPYVDSSAANRFSSRQRRIVVASAGIMVEVFLASLAMLLWVNLEPGLPRDLAFDVVIIGGVSTVLFNANPLLRFDGYYIFSELIEIPNLAGRSVQYLGYLLKTYVLDMPALRSPVSARGEQKWLFLYGISSMIYRLVISFVIAFWVAGKFFIIGSILALWAVISQVIYPFIANFYRLIPQVRAARKLPRLGVVLVCFLSLLLTVLLYPVGHSSYAEGIINLPEKALLRAGADGIIRTIQAPDGSSVDSGEPVLMLENLDLALRAEMLQARLDEARARQLDVLLLDRTQAEILKARVNALESELMDVQDQLHNLVLNSATQGRLFLPGVVDLPGKFVRRGEVIGYVADLRKLTAKVVIPQSKIDAVRTETQDIQVRFVSRPDEIIHAQYVRELPQATDRLPSRLLGTAGGGDIAIDVRDESGVQTITNTFQVEIALPMRNTGNYLGQTVLVRFIHPRKSIADQMLGLFDQFLMQEPFV